MAAAALMIVGALPASAAPGDGSAFGVRVSVNLVGIGQVQAGPFAAASTDGPNEDHFLSVNLPNVMTLNVINASASRDDATGQVDSRASIADLRIGLLGGPNTISFTLLEATCRATQSGVVGNSVLFGVDLGQIGQLPVGVPPNTVLTVPNVATITFNEQISNNDGSLTVNALHVRLLGGALGSIGSGDVILSSATCGPAGLPVPLASGAGLWISLGLVGMAVLPVSLRAVRRRSAALAGRGAASAA
jgi:hypothetical protein